MNFVKTSKVTAFLLLLCSFCIAESTPFSVSTPITPEMVETGEEPAINQLKKQALLDWLQGHLGNRFPQYEKSFDVDFVEKYILNYSVNRPSTQPPQLVVSGQIDSDGLRRWIKMVENRGASAGNRTVFLMSSSLPTQKFSASETAARTKESALGIALYQSVSGQIGKLGGSVLLAQGGAPNSSPPGAPHQLRDVKEYAEKQNANVVVWASISPCPQCIGSRVEIFIYDLEHNRIASSLSEDLPIHSRDLANTDTLRAQLAPLSQQFQAEVERVVSEGTLRAREYLLIFEGVQSYRHYKGTEQWLRQHPFLSNPSFSRAKSRVAEFRVTSSLSVDELTAKLQESEFQGKRFTAAKVDSGSIVLHQ